MNTQVTILMPCLNEAETLEICIKKAWHGIRDARVVGEVVIADNGSTDGSIEIAEQLGARVINVCEKGYGCALRGGIEAAESPWIIMGDSDDSYDFSNIRDFISKLEEGNDLVMGCRLPSGGGEIVSGAMPWKNRWIGNPSLSFLGRLFFKTPIRDFHCGMRAFSMDAYEKMRLQTSGMEFASEMVIKATLWGMKISEVPITLYPDGRSRPPHLKPWRDGWRHLRFMLIYSPRWLFLIPGIFLASVGTALTGKIYFNPIKIGVIVLDAGTMMISSMAIIIGFQLMSFAIQTKIYAVGQKLMPEKYNYKYFFRLLNLERGILIGGIFILIGMFILVKQYNIWISANYGFLNYSENTRNLILSLTVLVLGVQVISTSFFLSVLGLKTKNTSESVDVITSEKNIEKGQDLCKTVYTIQKEFFRLIINTFKRNIICKKKKNAILKRIPGFNEKSYSLTQGIEEKNAINHFIKHGLPRDEWFNEAITESSNSKNGLVKLKTALQVHVYYPEMLNGIIYSLRNSKIKPDILISTPHEKFIDKITKLVAQKYDGEVIVRLTPNRGRDIGAFLTAFSESYKKYDIIGHIHTKKSPHIKDREFVNSWYSYNLDSLIGGVYPMMDIIVENMCSNSKLGLVFPDDPFHIGWGENYSIAENLISKMNIDKKLPSQIVFPAGSMFWAKVSALAPLFNLELMWDDYPDEPIGDDGTILHAIERILPIVIKSMGYEVAVTHIKTKYNY